MQTIILLHGALGTAAQLEPLKQLLAGKYEVHTLNFPGHGGTTLPEEPFSIPVFAQYVSDYITRNKLEQVSIVGYSMGGYVGMYLAKHSPEKINKIITLATKFHWDEATAQQETKMLDPQQTLAKVPAFAGMLEKSHAPNDWKVVMNNTAAMLMALGQKNTLLPEDYPTINVPCLLLLGDRDKMIPLKETVETYQRLPNAQMGMLPNTPHPIEKANMKVLVSMIDCFL